LYGKAGEPAEGWGIYFREGFDRDITFGIVVLVILSTCFAVVWAVLKRDIQGAFAVASFLVAVCGMVMTLLPLASPIDKSH
jgi:inner membrane protein involved in colicin E2 resistance